jgi:hypothetical protein
MTRGKVEVLGLLTCMLVVLLVVPAGAVGRGCSAGKKITGLEYRLMSRQSTCVGNERIRVDQRGALYRSRNSVECKVGQLWTSAYPKSPVVQLTRAQRDSLFEAVRKRRILQLPAVIQNELVADGTVQEMIVVCGNARQMVTVINAKSPSFESVRDLLLRLAAP